MKTFPSLKND